MSVVVVAFTSRARIFGRMFDNSFQAFTFFFFFWLLFFLSGD